jgi:hypothetical protein
MVILLQMQDSWPSVEPEGQRGSPLPRVEDIPVVERGYDQDRVREAFDAFYRHVARLDATLRTIEAVEVFREQAAELRKELRALRTAGWTQQPWLPSYSQEPVRPGLPDAVFRWAVEACFVIAAPVAASAADLSRLWIVIVTAGAVAVVAAAEWVASVERPFAVSGPQTPTPAEEEAPPALASPEPAEAPEEAPSDAPAVQATEWTLPPLVAELAEEEESQKEEELTAVGPSAEEQQEPVAEAEAAEEPEPEPVLAEAEVAAVSAEEAVEPEEEPADEEAQPEAAAEPRRRGLWPWRRRRDGDDEDAGTDENRPRHVRVLPADGESGFGASLDPWEEELELDDEVEPEPTRPGG